jgi:branched-chain amino acid transport system ATP-binding protein
MSQHVLKVEGVNLSFGGLKALNEVNLEIEEGKVHAIIGPNGAGKSTLLNVCIGKLHPDSGSVNFRGKNITGKQPHEINQEGIVRVFQTPEIFPDLTIYENVMIPAFAKKEGKFKFNPFEDFAEEAAVLEEVDQLITEFGLEKQRNDLAGSLSRGDKRRLELAMGVIQHPKLFLLDEPTAGMSRPDTNKILDLLLKIKAGGMTKVIIEHDMNVVFSLADKIHVLAQGHIIAEGTPEEIKGNPIVQEAYLGGAQL